MEDLVDTTPLQQGVAVGATATFILDYSLTVPAYLCNSVVYLCVSTYPSYNSTYVEMDWAYNVSCFDVVTQLTCRPGM